MAVRMGDVYDALRSAGAADDKARKAAAEVAGYENRLATLDGSVSLLTWMVGFNLAMTLALVSKAFLSGHQS